MPLLVVTYHYFRETSYGSGIYPVNHAALVKQINTIGRTHRFIAQAELLHWVAAGDAGDAEPLCLVTFDDGLKEQMSAVRILGELGVPAICFVPTDPIVHHRTLDVHKLHFIRTRLDDRQLRQSLAERFELGEHQLDPKVLSSHYPYDNQDAQVVKYFINYVLNADQRCEFVDHWFDELVPNENEFTASLYMDHTDLRALAELDSLGAHGASHQPLASLSAARARADICQSVSTLQEIADTPIRTFSYPYGTESAVAPQLVDFLKAAGIDAAFTMFPGVNGNSERENPWYLKRLDTNDAPGARKVELH